MLILFIVVCLCAAVPGLVWSNGEQQRRAEQSMLESARVLALEMDAVWDFMEQNQGQFKEGKDGTARLYCVTAAKAVSRLFTLKSDYVIHYTNSQTRNPFDAPDDFEKEAVQELRDNPDLAFRSGLVPYEDGSLVYRYIEPLYVTESCLECHGEPKGELDPKGFPKEGQKVGDIAGVASIIIPAEPYLRSAREGLLGEVFLFFLVFVSAVVVLFFGIRHLVVRPVRRLGEAARAIGNGQFDVDVGSIGNGDELSDLAQEFGDMAQATSCAQERLEEAVEQRTAQLRTANEQLSLQHAKLEKANEQLRAESVFKSDFLAVMSHELRTPLTSILALSDLWNSKIEDAESEDGVIVREIRLNSFVIQSIVSDILEMARMNAGKSVVVAEEVDLLDLIDAMSSSLFASVAKRKGIELQVDVSRDVPIVFTDVEKVYHILDNLVSNALKFTSEGWVRISVDVAPGESESGDGPAVPGVRISVADTGCGIAPQDIPAIFDKFSQGAGGVHVGGGSGLGLAVARDLARLVEGELSVESTVGEGSCFTLWLPLRWEPKGGDEKEEGEHGEGAGC